MAFAPTDSLKLLELMKEYSEKLFFICEKRQRTQFNQFISIFGFMAITATGSLLALTYREKLSTTQVTGILAYSIVCMAAIPLLYRRKSAIFYSAAQIAATTERLIRMVSHYYEHSPSSIGNRFEVELRIGEAEGALAYYYRVFDSAPKRDFMDDSRHHPDAPKAKGQTHQYIQTMRFLLDERNADFRKFLQGISGDIEGSIPAAMKSSSFADLANHLGLEIEPLADNDIERFLKDRWESLKVNGAQYGVWGGYATTQDNKVYITPSQQSRFDNCQRSLHAKISNDLID